MTHGNGHVKFNAEINHKRKNTLCISWKALCVKTIPCHASNRT